jgi:hypothetical protein
MQAGDAREVLLLKIEAMAERQADALARAGCCALCERPVSRAEAEALMAKHRGESYMGWLARLVWKPVPDREGDGGGDDEGTGVVVNGAVP